MEDSLKPGVTGLYCDHVMAILGYEVPDVPSGEALVAVAKRITVPPAEAEQGWRTDPPFPGVAEKPAEMRGRWRMICATRLYIDNREAAVMFMTLVSGRRIGINLNPPGTHIPKEYLPLSSR